MKKILSYLFICLSRVLILKPWPNGVASRLKLKTWVNLRALALTCDDLRSLWSRSNLLASQRRFFTVWPADPSQRKLSDVR